MRKQKSKKPKKRSSARRPRAHYIPKKYYKAERMEFEKLQLEISQEVSMKTIEESIPEIYRWEESRRLLLRKSPLNPILRPRNEYPWEAYQTFNPGILLLDGKVHIIYRAIGVDGISRFGYAVSNDGFKIDERLPNPIYQRKMNNPSYYPSPSGGGYGGCEDPRIVVMREDGKIYMTYNAFGPSELRVAFTSIDIDDFINRRWNWREEKIISNPSEVHKNFVIFPEKIDGRYAILHSISPRIQVSYLDDLEFNDGEYIESYHFPNSNPNGWEGRVKSPGAPPLKTDEGWLLFYHGLSKNEPWKYKIGVMLLDLEKPEEVLYASSFPVIQPDQPYEYSGFKPGVTYTCGAIIKDRELMVYYGAADTYVCVAHSPLDEFLDALRRDRDVKEKIGLSKLFINGFNESYG
jgi:predicted GH43/DUF377 family glycosyl hydrolase